MNIKIDKRKTLLVNFFGGPGAGKSTTAAHLFTILKKRGVSCELVREFAKDLVWEARTVEFYDQLSILGRQIARINACIGKVDVVINDSPIILSAYYNEIHNKELFDKVILETHNFYNNLNIIVTRTKVYNPEGRFETEEQAKMADENITSYLERYNIPYMIFNPEGKGLDYLADLVVSKIQIKKTAE